MQCLGSKVITKQVEQAMVVPAIQVFRPIDFFNSYETEFLSFPASRLAV